jgi:acetoin utilization protein AcuB
MFVRDRMSSPAVTITPDRSLQDALKLMHERQFRRLPVVDDRGKLIGIVSERDLLYASSPPAGLLGGKTLDDLLPELRVKEIMTEEVISAAPHAFVEEAARLMADNKIGGLPVVDEDNQVVGVITETDVFRAFIDIYRAGHSGLYLTLEVPDRKGIVVELSRAIFDWAGNIVSVNTFYDDPRGEHKLIIKGHDIEKDQVVGVLESLGYHVIEAYELQAERSNRKG